MRFINDYIDNYVMIQEMTSTHTSKMVENGKIIYYSEVPVDNCWDVCQNKYQSIIYTYVIQHKILWFKYVKIKQSIPYIENATYDGERRTNRMLREIARREYYDAMMKTAGKNCTDKKGLKENNEQEK